MNRVVIVQSVIPNYSMSFFNLLSEELKKNGWELHIIADIHTTVGLNQYRECESKFKVTHHIQKSKFNILIDFGLKDIIDNINPKCIIFSGNVRAPFYFYLMWLYKRKGITVSSWGMFHRIGGNRFITEQLYRLYSYLSDSILTYSVRGRNNLIDLNVNKNKIKVIGTAIDESVPFEHSRYVSLESIKHKKEQYKLDESLVVIQVVRLSKIKKPSMLIDVADIIVNKRGFSNVKFILIGDGDLKNEIEKAITEKKLTDNCILLGSIYSEKELAVWFNIADIYAIPTCIGLGAHHAMAYGLPIITDNSYLNQASEFDIIQNELNGITYEEGDIEEFADKIIMLLENKEKRDFLSKNALYTVSNIYNLRNKVNNFMKSIVKCQYE
ncbi:glycosyltransferase family 4 protein [Photobacterium damselae]|uniref:glycosyltransferase family 4 protein n=1 Tax=Photobacterium damselae TaxID=38293 RepID=UPI0015A2A0DD|nr:glycosyltransferase family 4 protein [Photobacterium damselae]NVO60953.1 glycosyltransferase family 4 protein [Photobacterium damselae subsp. damselae]